MKYGALISVRRGDINRSDGEGRCRTDPPVARVTYRSNHACQRQSVTKLPISRVSPSLPPPRGVRACVSAYSSQPPLQSADGSLLRVTRNSVCQNGPTDRPTRPPTQRPPDTERESRQEAKGVEGLMLSLLPAVVHSLTQTKRQRPTLQLSLSPLPAIRSDPFSK